MPKASWREDAWEKFLKKFWDIRQSGKEEVEYSKADLETILSKYKESGRGEIRIFHSGAQQLEAVRKRGVSVIPLSRTSWKLVASPPGITFEEPLEEKVFVPLNQLTEGMRLGVIETMRSRSNPGETTLLAIANHVGVIADFYGLKDKGVLFTGGRQKAAVHIVIDNKEVDISKAQIEIDGGFEWPDGVVIGEMKSSFKQKNFNLNQALFPMLKWQKLLPNKKVYSLILLGQTNAEGIEYWAYDACADTSSSSIGMRISRSKKYKISVT